MKITVTNFNLKDHYAQMKQVPLLEFIHPALKEFSRLKIPVPIASRMTKNITAVETAISDYEKTRISIVESLCEKDKDDKPVTENNQYKFSEEGLKEFNQKWNELLSTEIPLQIKVINEADIEKLEINGTCYQTLVKYGFIKEKEEPIERVKQNGQADKKELSEAN